MHACGCTAERRCQPEAWASTVSLKHILQQVAGPIGTKSPVRVSLGGHSGALYQHPRADSIRASLTLPSTSMEVSTYPRNSYLQ